MFRRIIGWAKGGVRGLGGVSRGWDRFGGGWVW